jgi:hypothetical protein
LFYGHCNCKGEVTVIPSPMGTRLGDPLGGTLFVLDSIVSHLSSCLLPFIVDDIHIIGPLSIVSSTYEHFQIELHMIGFFLSNLKNVQHGPPLICRLTLTPHPCLMPHQRNLGFEGSIGYLILHIIFHQRCFIVGCSTC